MKKCKIKLTTTYNDGMKSTSYFLKQGIFTEFTDSSRAKIFNSKKEARAVINSFEKSKNRVYEIVECD